MFQMFGVGRLRKRGRSGTADGLRPAASRRWNLGASATAAVVCVLSLSPGCDAVSFVTSVARRVFLCAMRHHVFEALGAPLTLKKGTPAA